MRHADVRGKYLDPEVKYWIVKSDTADYSIEDFRKDRTTLWDGVRNYQARNFLKEMEPGDMVFFYQSVTEPIGVAGLAVVHGKAVPDPTQFDRRSRYFDERSSRDKPVWFCPEIRFVKQFRAVTGLDELRRKKGLEKMTLLKRGNRLSVMPVSEKEFGLVMELVKQ